MTLSLSHCNQKREANCVTMPKITRKNKGDKKGVGKALKAQKAHKKGVQHFKRKLRRTVHFYVKPTLRQARNPQYARKVSTSIQFINPSTKYQRIPSRDPIHSPFTLSIFKFRVESQSSAKSNCNLFQAAHSLINFLIHENL